jgi:hypothetical protein
MDISNNHPLGPGVSNLLVVLNITVVSDLIL